jgi:hypothetical protein
MASKTQRNWWFLVEKTLSEMVKLWGNTSCQTISRALKKVNFTRKKDLWVQKRSEENRAEFLKILATKNPKDLIYRFLMFFLEILDACFHHSLCKL